MGHRRYDKPKEKVPVPDNARVYKNGRVVLVDTSVRGGKDPMKTVIGHVCVGETDENGRQLMYPNKNYEECCKDDWAKSRAGPDGKVPDVPPDVVHVGLYALVLGIVYKLGIYQMLISVYNEQIANAMIDLAMFYILIRQNDINVMKPKMNEQLVFSIESYNDSWYGELFKGKDQERSVTDASNQEFMIRWVRHVKANLYEKDGRDFGSAVLSLDGTNWENQSETNTDAKTGKAKSGKITEIVGSMFCVVANGKYKGLPLAYYPTVGSSPDSKTYKEMVTFFHGFDLYPEVMVADRAFCTEDFMVDCESLLLPFIIMMHEDYTGAQTMHELYSDLLPWNYEYRMLGHGLTFGISENGHKVFGPNSKNPDRTANLAEFYNAARAFYLIKNFISSLDQQIKNLNEEIESFEAKRRTQAGMSNNSSAIAISTDIVSKDELINQALKQLSDAKIQVPDGYEEYIAIEYNLENNKYHIVEDYEAVSKKCSSYGYYCLVTSEEMTAQEISDKYVLRDTSEKVFSSAKSEIGFDSFEVSGTESFHGKLFSCFIAIIIRNRIEYECRHYEKKKVIDTNEFIAELDTITYKRTGAGYRYTGQISTVQNEILSRYGISGEMIRQLGGLVNARNNDMLISQLSQTARTIPEIKATPKGDQPDTSGTENSKEPPSEQPKPRGRPKGSKNKETVEKEAKQAEENQSRIEKGLSPIDLHPGSGRKLGSKNKKTLDKEAQEAADAANLAEENRRREEIGLPPLEPEKKSKRSGASKNNNTSQEAQTGDKPIRGGRKTGSVNKKTLAQEEYDRQLSKLTGVDIIGNPPPRPWDAATRYAENKRRAKLRKIAEEIKERMEKESKTDDPKS